jgi:ABC-type glycerol-3-phosphate transport system permease component
VVVGTQQQKGLRRVILIALQLLLVVVVLLPFFWMFSVSLKPGDEPFAIPARLWPERPTFANYQNAFYPEFRRYFLNSTIVSLVTIANHIGTNVSNRHDDYSYLQNRARA